MTIKESNPLISYVSDQAPLLISFLKSNAEIRHILPGRRLGFKVGDKRFCYIILKGSGIVHRNSDDRVMSTVVGPAIVGLSNLDRVEIDGYIKIQVLSEVVSLNMHTVYDIVSSNQLWEPLAKHMMVLVGKAFQFSEQLSAPSAYSIVRTQLNELIKESNTFRNSITAERYIRDKTRLSRSRIMEILAALKKGGFIETNRGKLTNINKLPEEF